MRWRERQKGQILEALRATLRHEKLEELALQCEDSRISCDRIVLDCGLLTTPTRELTICTQSCTAPIIINAQFATVLVDYCPCIRTIDMFVGEWLRMFKFGLTINPPRLFKYDLTINLPWLFKFAFLARREDHGLFGSQHDSAQRITPLHPVPKVPRESSTDNHETLEERLRWILTPPIHELLSDPCLGLPETPYDYQVRGIAWLRAHNSALLADEM